MSDDVVIELKDVSLKFKLQREKTPSLKEVIIKFLTRKVSYVDFYALKDINLKVKRGESVGIIGRNGAGKTTLLRVIAGIYKPTSGKVTVKGRIMPIIELGAGFDMELTGRENIFLNGLLLGMTRKEIEERYDEIGEFSGLGEFINSPMRTYSSGMKLRLGFSIATAIDPDIILIDEVFAVGDREFREKCVRRIREMREKGATLLFVSHDMDAIKENCERVIWLEEGEIMIDDESQRVIRCYSENTLKGTWRINK